MKGAEAIRSRVAQGATLVAVPASGQATVRLALGDCRARFVSDYAQAAAVLRRGGYALIVVGLHFGESRMFDFIRLVRAAEPSARIIAVRSEQTQLGASALLGVRTALQALGVDGLVELAEPSGRDLEAISQIRCACAGPTADCRIERGRIGLVLERDGPEATREWVKRTLGIYRRAVLDRSHFASTPAYKSMYVASCADFRRWLRLNPP